jgi:hypothetical protein
VFTETHHHLSEQQIDEQHQWSDPPFQVVSGSSSQFGEFYSTIGDLLHWIALNLLGHQAKFVCGNSW